MSEASKDIRSRCWLIITFKNVRNDPEERTLGVERCFLTCELQLQRHKLNHGIIVINIVLKTKYSWFEACSLHLVVRFAGYNLLLAAQTEWDYQGRLLSTSIERLNRAAIRTGTRQSDVVHDNAPPHVAKPVKTLQWKIHPTRCIQLSDFHLF